MTTPGFHPMYPAESVLPEVARPASEEAAAESAVFREQGIPHLAELVGNGPGTAPSAWAASPAPGRAARQWGLTA